MAGMKMYEAEDYPWMERKASKTQTYQVVNILGDTLQLETYTVNGLLYDAFELHKKSDGTTETVNKIPDLPEF